MGSVLTLKNFILYSEGGELMAGFDEFFKFSWPQLKRESTSSSIN